MSDRSGAYGEYPWPMSKLYGPITAGGIMSAAFRRNGYCPMSLIMEDIEAFLWRLRSDVDDPEDRNLVEETADILLMEWIGAGKIAMPDRVMVRGVIYGTGISLNGGIGYDVMIGDPEDPCGCVLSKNMEFSEEDDAPDKRPGSECHIMAYASVSRDPAHDAVLLGIHRFPIAKGYIRKA